ncbi:MAG: TolC family protein, partial [Opitutales bacterium]
PRESSREFRPERDILAPARKVTEESVSAGKVGKEKMTLAECIVVALENNPQTRSSWQAARAASDRAGEKKAPYLPYVDFSTGVSRSDAADIDSGRERESGPTTTYDAAFGVRYLLYDGGRRAANLSEAQAQLYAANFRHNTALQDVALSVEEAYYQLIANMWSAEVAEETVAQTEHHVGVARARHESGVVSRSDVLKARTERANARLQLVRAKSAVKVSRGKLAGAMNLKVSEKVEVEDIPEENRDREIAAVEKLLQEAARGRPELQAALAEVQSRQAGIRAARSEYRPDLTANANYGWRDENFAPNEEEWSAGLGLSLPLFTGFERSYRTRRAESELQQAISDYENALRSVALDVWTAYAGVQEADEAIEAAQALVASAEESLEVARSEYKEGAGSITELIDAQTAYSQARNHLVQSRLDWHENLARLDRAVGRSVNKQALNLKRDK